MRIGKTDYDIVSLSALMEQLDELVNDPQPHYVCFTDSFQCVYATQDAKLRAIHAEASLVLPDGVGLTVGARLLGRRFPDRLPGPVVMLAYCEHGLAQGRRHFFYGGAEGVAPRLKDKLQQQFPGIEVAGTYSPPFRPLTGAEEADVKRRIEDSGAEVLWVGLGAPKQEYWMADHVGRINVPLMLGVGAAFDFHSGHRKWAPAWIRKAGLEWVYRMATGGRRILIRNAKYDTWFLLMVLKQALTRGADGR